MRLNDADAFFNDFSDVYSEYQALIQDLIEIRRWCMIFGAIQLVSGILLMLAYAL